MKKIIFILFVILPLMVGCSTNQKYLCTPFKTFYVQPPGDPKTWPQPIQLEDIDNSGIFVFTNGEYWYSGPRSTDTRGWIPIAVNRTSQYPLPGDVWQVELCIVEKKIK